MNPISEFIASAIYEIKWGMTLSTPEDMMTGVWKLLATTIIPLFLIAIIALAFGILNYRTNKKILKKLEGMESK